MLIQLVDICTECRRYGCERFVGFITPFFRIKVRRKVKCLRYAGRKPRVTYVEPAYTNKGILPYLTWNLNTEEGRYFETSAIQLTTTWRK